MGRYQSMDDLGEFKPIKPDMAREIDVTLSRAKRERERGMWDRMSPGMKAAILGGSVLAVAYLVGWMSAPSQPATTTSSGEST